MSRPSVSMFLGLVLRRNNYWNAVRVRVEKLRRHNHLNIYYNQSTHYWVVDEEERCREGDIVLIKLLREPKNDTVTHYIKEVVFPVGNIRDPVTGRRCKGPMFINEDLRKFGPVKEEVKS